MTALVAGLSLTPASAAAQAVIGPQTITVSTPGASATIVRRPFRIAIAGSGGAPALSEVANSSGLPAPILPVPYPPLFGSRPLPEGSLYAPLTFLVGSATTTQWGGGSLFFQGNQQNGTLSGVQYSAQAVTAAVPDAGGVRLTLSTDDPSGRQLMVTVTPGPGASIRVRASALPADGVALISDSFASDPQEAFHGFGGRHNAIDQHGNDFYSWAEEENSVGIPGGGPAEDASNRETNYMFPNGPEAAYAPQPLFVSSHPYGFLLDQPQFARFRMDSDTPDAWQVNVYGDQLNYLVAPGPAAQAIATLTKLTGRERVPPAWASGPEIDRAAVGNAGQPEPVANAEIASDLAHITADHLPVTAYRLEPWAQYTPAQLRAMAAALHRRHIHLLVYFRAFAANPTAGLEPDNDFSYAVAHGLVVRDANGNPAIFAGPQGGSGALLDFTNPATVAWWQGRIDAALNAGIDGFMLDYGEQTDADWRFANGETGATMHNAYPVLYDRVTRMVVDAWMRTHPGRRIFFFTRSGYTGDPGSEAYTNAEFLGDNTTSWDHASGIAAVLPDMLNRGIGGAFGADTDIGGYLDVTTPPTTAELFDRWAELAALTPFFRVHNSGATGTNMPWSFDPATLATYRAMAALHVAAQPLILRLWREADATGIPVLRPLWLQFPGDRSAAVQDEEFMLGPDVLSAPVVTQGATSRSVYLPAGCWRQAGSGAPVRGPQTVTVPAPLGTLPYFVRCGTHPLTPAGHRHHHGHRHRRRRRSRHPRRQTHRRYDANGPR